MNLSFFVAAIIAAIFSSFVQGYCLPVDERSSERKGQFKQLVNDMQSPNFDDPKSSLASSQINPSIFSFILFGVIPGTFAIYFPETLFVSAPFFAFIHSEYIWQYGCAIFIPNEEIGLVSMGSVVTVDSDIPVGQRDIKFLFDQCPTFYGRVINLTDLFGNEAMEVEPEAPDQSPVENHHQNWVLIKDYSPDQPLIANNEQHWANAISNFLAPFLCFVTAFYALVCHLSMMAQILNAKGDLQKSTQEQKAELQKVLSENAKLNEERKMSEKVKDELRDRYFDNLDKIEELEKENQLLRLKALKPPRQDSSTQTSRFYPYTPAFKWLRCRNYGTQTSVAICENNNPLHQESITQTIVEVCDSSSRTEDLKQSLHQESSTQTVVEVCDSSSCKEDLKQSLHQESSTQTVVEVCDSSSCKEDFKQSLHQESSTQTVVEVCDSSSCTADLIGSAPVSRTAIDSSKQTIEAESIAPVENPDHCKEKDADQSGINSNGSSSGSRIREENTKSVYHRPKPNPNINNVNRVSPKKKPLNNASQAPSKRTPNAEKTRPSYKPLPKTSPNINKTNRISPKKQLNTDSFDQAPSKGTQNVDKTRSSDLSVSALVLRTAIDSRTRNIAPVEKRDQCKAKDVNVTAQSGIQSNGSSSGSKIREENIAPGSKSPKADHVQPKTSPKINNVNRVSPKKKPENNASQAPSKRTPNAEKTRPSYKPLPKTSPNINKTNRISSKKQLNTASFDQAPFKGTQNVDKTRPLRDSSKPFIEAKSIAPVEKRGQCKAKDANVTAESGIQSNGSSSNSKLRKKNIAPGPKSPKTSPKKEELSASSQPNSDAVAENGHSSKAIATSSSAHVPLKTDLESPPSKKPEEKLSDRKIFGYIFSKVKSDNRKCDEEDKSRSDRTKAALSKTWSASKSESRPGTTSNKGNDAHKQEMSNVADYLGDDAIQTEIPSEQKTVTRAPIDPPVAVSKVKSAPPVEENDNDFLSFLNHEDDGDGNAEGDAVLPPAQQENVKEERISTRKERKILIPRGLSKARKEQIDERVRICAEKAESADPEVEDNEAVSNSADSEVDASGSTCNSGEIAENSPEAEPESTSVPQTGNQLELGQQLQLAYSKAVLNSGEIAPEIADDLDVHDVAEKLEIATQANQTEVAMNETSIEPSTTDSACQSNPMSQIVSRSSSRLDFEKQGVPKDFGNENGELEAMEIEKDEWSNIANDLFGPSQNGVLVKNDERMSTNTNSGNPFLDKQLDEVDYVREQLDLFCEEANRRFPQPGPEVQPIGGEAATEFSNSSNVETSKGNDMDIDELNVPKEFQFQEDTTQSQLMEYQFNDPPKGGPLDIFANDSPEEIAKRSLEFRITSDMTEKEKYSNLSSALLFGCTKVPTDDNHHYHYDPVFERWSKIENHDEAPPVDSEAVLDNIGKSNRDNHANEQRESHSVQPPSPPSHPDQEMDVFDMFCNFEPEDDEKSRGQDNSRIISEPSIVHASASSNEFSDAALNNEETESSTEHASARTNQVEDTGTSSLDLLSDIASSRKSEQQPLERTHAGNDFEEDVFAKYTNFGSSDDKEETERNRSSATEHASAGTNQVEDTGTSSLDMLFSVALEQDNLQ